MSTGEVRRLLIVDDDPVSVRTIVALLRDEPYRMIWADNAMGALTLATLHKPDAILLSWTLVGMNGDQFAELLDLNPATSDISLILLSLEPWLFGERCRDKAAQVVDKSYIYRDLSLRVRDAMNIPLPSGMSWNDVAWIRDRSLWWAGEEDPDWRSARDVVHGHTTRIGY